jgi:predicted LPLAT superfamily acyltransferase
VRDFTAPNVPDSSRFGRKFSNLWIRIETGKWLADTQSGYRAYPVGLLSRIPLGSRRYDFEVEVLVRGLWAGLPTAEVPIATWYAPPGERISHFHKWKDNARISRLHARLVGRRLAPWPMRRLAPAAEAPRTPRGPDRNDRGNALGFWFFRTALAFTGLRGAYGLLYFVCAYYLLVDRRAFAAADAYLRRRFPGRSRVARRWLAYRLFISQGKCLIDRHAHNVGRVEFAFDTRGTAEVFLRLEGSANGFVLLLSHTGGWQLALPFLRAGTGARPVSLLMHEAETPDIRRNVRGDDAGFHVISPDLGPAAAIEMVMRLQRGEIVSIMGDRAYGGQTAEAPFLGEPAHFPASAFAVARAAQCPVLALFVPKTGPFSYAIEAVLFEAPARDNRPSIREGVRDFAAALESFVRRHPDQCFLFCDIWRKELA